MEEFLMAVKGNNPIPQLSFFYLTIIYRQVAQCSASVWRFLEWSLLRFIGKVSQQVCYNGPLYI